MPLGTLTLQAIHSISRQYRIPLGLSVFTGLASFPLVYSRPVVDLFQDNIILQEAEKPPADETMWEVAGTYSLY